jgi:hypothetical protein
VQMKRSSAFARPMLLLSVSTRHGILIVTPSYVYTSY